MDLSYIDPYPAAKMSSAKYLVCINIILPIAPIVPYENSLDPVATPSYLASQSDPNCLTFGLQFHKLWTNMKHYENCCRRDIWQTTFFHGGIRVKTVCYLTLTCYEKVCMCTLVYLMFKNLTNSYLIFVLIWPLGVSSEAKLFAHDTTVASSRLKVTVVLIRLT